MTVHDNSLANRAVDLLIYAVLFALAALMMLPFVFVLSSSISKNPGFLPDGFDLGAYKYILSAGVFPRSLGVSVYITVVGTLISLLITAMMAYALSEKMLPFRKSINLLILLTVVFVPGMIPTFIVVRKTGLLNSLWALIIPSAVNAFNLIVLRGFFASLPEELKESARIDGCHELRILFQIIIPLSLPAMATFGLFYAVAKWNMYFNALLYISDPTKWPVQVLLRQIINSSAASIGESDQALTSIAESVRYAVIVLSTLPILVIYPFLQKYFAKGALLGSVKG